MNVALNCWLSQCYNINCKTVTTLFYLLISQLTVYNRTIPSQDLLQTIRLFISEWDRRYDWLQTTAEHDIIWSMWDGDHSELFFCIHLNGEFQFHGKSNELTDAFLACHPDWAQGPSLLCDKPLTRVADVPGRRALRSADTHQLASVQQTVDVSKFPTLVGHFTQQPSCL